MVETTVRSYNLNCEMPITCYTKSSTGFRTELYW